MKKILALDYGLTNLDALLLEIKNNNHANSHTVLAQHQENNTSGNAPEQNLESLKKILKQFEKQYKKIPDLIATTGGRHKELPTQIFNIPILPIGESVAIGRGGLALAGLEKALVVSAGTGTAMIGSNASSQQFIHLSGSAVGGGTLLGLSRLLLNTTDVEYLGELATRGNASNIDSTLRDAIGGGIGHLPETATAVNFGRVAKLDDTASIAPQDIAAALVTLIAQVIGVIAMNTARANDLKNVVVVGRLLQLPSMRARLDEVWDFYGIANKPIVPEQGGFATALGAGLSAGFGAAFQMDNKK